MSKMVITEPKSIIYPPAPGKRARLHVMFCTLLPLDLSDNGLFIESISINSFP